jgi:septum formation protein
VTTVVSVQAPLVLGSASPRRREILTGLGIPILVVPAEVDESVRPAESPERYLERVVLDKLASARARVGERSGACILVADTSVVLGSEILGKPGDHLEAVSMLERLGGTRHRVLTRYALGDVDGTPLCARTVETEVWMRAASAEELQRYAATGEGLDKAGAYAVQGIGSFLVERIVGSYSNVVGLPACEVIVDLKQLGLLGPFP